MTTYCPLPFKHVFIEPRGIKPCCSYTKIYPGSVNEWLSSNEHSELCNDILNNTINDGCAQCLDFEKVSGTSTRLGSFKDYPIHYTTVDIDYVDYRASNLCNYRCRSCSPEFSHGILNDIKKSKKLQDLYSDTLKFQKLALTQQHNTLWLKNNLKSIKRLMFTGGEPTLIPEVKEILINTEQSDYSPHIIIITNGSFSDDFWYKLIKRNKNINWTLSLDADGNKAEVIRHGTNWNQVDKNIEFLAEHSVSFNFSTVVSSLNVFHLNELFEYLNNIRSKFTTANGKTQFISMCNYPNYLSPYNWPEAQKNNLLKYLRDTKLKHPDKHLELNNLITTITNHIFNNDLWNKGLEYNQEIDIIRNQKSLELLNL